MAAGNKHLSYKAALNDLEVDSAGAKLAFYFGVFDRAADRFAAPTSETGDVPVTPRESYGAPSSNGVCAFYRLTERATQAVPIEMGRTRRPRRVRQSVDGQPLDRQ